MLSWRRAWDSVGLALCFKLATFLTLCFEVYSRALLFYIQKLGAFKILLPLITVGLLITKLVGFVDYSQ